MSMGAGAWTARLPVREQLLAVAFVAPALAWLGATLLYPLHMAVHLSAHDIGIIGSEGRFIGFANYRAILSDSQFIKALGRSALWVAANAIVQTALALGAALLLAERFPGVRL